MSTLVRLSLLFVGLLLRCVALALNTWTCWKCNLCVQQVMTAQSVKNAIRPQSPRVSNDLSGLLTTTSAAAIAVYISSTSALLTGSVEIERSMRGNFQGMNKLKIWTLFWWVMLVNVSAFALSNILISNVAFLRLIHVFDKTKYRLTNREITIVKSLFVLFYSVITSSTIIVFMRIGNDYFSNGIILLLSAIVFITFPCLNTWIIWCFFYKSIDLLSGMEDHNSHNNNNHQSDISAANNNTTTNITSMSELSETSNMSLESKPPKIALTSQQSSDLAHTSLRVSISCGIPLLASLMAGVIGIIAIYERSWIMRIFVGRNLAVLVTISRCFGLLCTFKSAQNYYDLVFGSIHRWIFQHIFIHQAQVRRSTLKM